jgi:hypothetical protein
MKQERGFALLLVFVLAAAIALMLYKELPRVAFEAQRNKEALLIERGEQYQRAIQLYFRKFKKYPVKIEDLESTNQLRFLRKRYDDPMTGKSEWRLIHIGAGGVFTDSLTHKPPSLDKDKDPKAANTFTYEAPAIGSTLTDPTQTTGFAPVRPSERAGLPGMPGQTPGQAGQPNDPSNPQSQQPGAAGYVAGNPNANPNLPPGMYPQQGVNPLQLGQQPYGQQQAGTNPGSVVNSQTGGASPAAYPYSTQPGAQGTTPSFGQPGAAISPNGQPGGGQAMNLINQILTTPRQFPGAAQPMAGLQIAPGIAGVASTATRKGIKIYNDKQKYNEWEFIYDLTKDTAGTAGTTGIAGAGSLGQNQPGAQGQTQGQQTQGNSSTFGGASPFGGTSPFGTPSPFGQQPQQPPQAQPQQLPQQQPQPPQQPQVQGQPTNP